MEIIPTTIIKKTAKTFVTDSSDITVEASLKL